MKEDVEDEINILQKKVEYFFKNKTQVHITFKKKYWKNGVIIKNSNDFFILQDKFETVMIFYLEISSIQPYAKNAGPHRLTKEDENDKNT